MTFKKYRNKETGEIAKIKEVSKSITGAGEQFYSVITSTEEGKRKTKFLTDYQVNQQYAEVSDNEK